MKKALVIINPHAGRMKIMRDIADVDMILYDGGFEPDIYFTKSRGDATRKVIESGSNYDLIVCGGGDGTYNEVMSGILDAGLCVSVGYIPAGTTNDFATTLNLSFSHKSAAQRIIMGKPCEIDVGRFDNRYFSYIASFGAFTSASYSANQKTKNTLGHTAYILEGIKDLSSLRPYHVKVETDTERFEDDFIFGAVCNSKSIAGIIKLDDRIVDLSDGFFELVLLRMPKQIIDLPKMLVALQNGDSSDKNVVFVHTKKVSIETEGKLNWALDGEKAESVGRVEIENLNKAISIML